MTHHAVLYTENHPDKFTTFLGVYSSEEAANEAIEEHMHDERLRLPNGNITHSDYQIFYGEIDERYWVF